MTCFWNGILNCLNKDDFEKFNLNNKPKPTELVNLLKNNNLKCINIKWQDEKLENQLETDLITSRNNEEDETK